MSAVCLANVSKAYGDTYAVRDFSLTIAEGELVALLGPSGCGKTTTLRMLAGFIRPTHGRIAIGGRDVTAVPPYRRSTGMVFQGYALFPHMTVAQNVAFGLEMRRVARDEIATRVAAALRRVRLTGFEERHPRQLSGGQQQRVALARALVINPDVLLLDEPLSNLDAKLRHDVRIEIRQLQQELRLTTAFVTHDQEEALTVADRLVVMNQGAIAQIGTPRELYEAPRTAFVAGFIGTSNVFDGALAGPGLFRTRSGDEIAFSGSTAPDPVLVVRPERMRIVAPAAESSAENRLSGTIRIVTFLGATTEIIVALASGQSVTIHVATASLDAGPAKAGEPVEVVWPKSASLILDGRDRTLPPDVNGGPDATRPGL